MRGCAGSQHVSPGVLICETHYLEDYKHLVVHVLHFLHLLFSFTKYQRMLTEYPSWFDKHLLRKKNNTTTAYAKQNIPLQIRMYHSFPGRHKTRLVTVKKGLIQHCERRWNMEDVLQGIHFGI
jgi:hypothetical protein